jgi:mannose-1-phosphate guanylyltransferase
VIGPNVVVKSGSKITNSVIMSDCTIENSSFIDGSIIGWKSLIGSWVRIEGLSILGEDVAVADNLFINSSIILPNCKVKTSIKNPGSIIMF